MKTTEKQSKENGVLFSAENSLHYITSVATPSHVTFVPFSALFRFLLYQFHLSARPFVCLSVTSRSTAKTVTGRLLWGAYKKSPPGYSGHPSPTPYDHPFSKLGVTTPHPIKNVHRKLRPNGARYMGTYNRPTQQYPRGTHSPKGVVKNFHIWGKLTHKHRARCEVSLPSCSG